MDEMELFRKTTDFSGIYTNNLNGKTLDVRYYESSGGCHTSMSYKYSSGRIFGISREIIAKKVASGEWTKA